MFHLNYNILINFLHNFYYTLIIYNYFLYYKHINHIIIISGEEVFNRFGFFDVVFDLPLLSIDI